MPTALACIATTIGWLAYALDPTITGAAIAAFASVLNTWLLIRHERKVTSRFDERRQVIVKGTPDDADAFFMRGEERRQLEREDDQ